MKLKDLLKGVKVKKVYADLETDIKGLCYHSQRCGKDYAYFVRKGLKYDGFRFLPDCFKKGVSVFFGEEAIEGYPFIVVEDILEVQAIVSSNFYGNPQNFLKIVGVTGTNGKTTTCYLLKRGLNAGLISTVDIITGKRKERATLTTPESTDVFRYLREMVDSGYRYAVIEVSAHALSRKRVSGIDFDAVVFTSFSRDHLDYYKTMDNYLNAKLKIFSALKDDGFCVVNRDIEVFNKIEKRCPNMLTVGFGENSEIRIEKVTEVDHGLGIEYKIEGEILKVNFPLIGRYNAYNLGFALGVLKGFNKDLKDFIEEIEKGFSVPGRVETLKSPEGITAVVDFAHTPEGLDVLLSSVKEHTKGKLIVVFGCGGERDRTKRPLMLESVCRYADIVFVTADNPRGEKLSEIFADIKKGKTFGKEVNYIEDRKDAIFNAVKSAKKGDIVVVAGKGHEDCQIIGEEKIPFSDKKTILEAFEL